MKGVSGEAKLAMPSKDGTEIVRNKLNQVCENNKSILNDLAQGMEKIEEKIKEFEDLNPPKSMLESHEMIMSSVNQTIEEKFSMLNKEMVDMFRAINNKLDMRNPEKKKMGKKRVAVIGAGSMGLAMIKCLKEENIEPVCFEKTIYYGGLWRYHDDDTEGVASVMKTTIINTSKEMGSLSDSPFPEDLPNYMHNTEIYKCFKMFAKKHDLLKHITYNKEVTKIELAEDYVQTGRLKVRVKDTQNGEESEDIYDGVTVCIGHHVYPNFPTFPGQKNFGGKILHTHSLKTVDSFKDQVVVVVGVGNSGMDAAVEISSVAKQIYLSTRRGTWVVPRVGPSGMPFDMVFSSRFANGLFKYLPFNLCCAFMEAQLNFNFNHFKYNLKPRHRFLSQHPSVSDTLPIKLLSGTVVVRRNIQEFVEDGVVFKGEDTVTEADAIVFATGYLIKFPFISEEITTTKHNKVHLYKYMYPPHLPHNTFAIMGLIQSVGAGFPIGEAQARLFCQVFNDKVKLPSKEIMEADIYAKEKALEKRYVSSSRHTIQVDYITYLDEVYSMMGAKPNFLKMLFTDPKLFFVLFFGPSLPYQYRLQGPHPWPGARDAILTYKRRVFKPLKKNYVPKKINALIAILNIFLVVCLFFFARRRF